MGLSTTTNRVLFTGDGATLTFNFPYYFFATSALKVYLYDTILKTAVLQTLGSSYSVSGTPNSSGLYPNGANVVMAVAPATTDILIVYRDSPRTQAYALLQNGQISSTALVQQFDYMTMLIQRLEDQISRCIMVPDGMGETFSNQLPNNIGLFPSAGVLVNDTGDGWQLGSQSGFQKVTKTYADFQTASTTNTVKLFTLPATAMLKDLVIKSKTAFTGSSISALLGDIGVSGSTSKFIGSYDLLAAVSDTNWDSVSAGDIESWASGTDVNLVMTATGANLSALSAGAFDCFYRYAIV